MKLSFVAPCFNEEHNIEPFLKSIYEVFPNTKEYEVVFINDGSVDNTLKVLKEMKENVNMNIKIISFSRNFGKESAIYAGLEHADGDLVNIIDTDLQQSPEVVKDMIDILDNNEDVDCVCAVQKDRDESKFIASCKNTFYKIADKYTDAEFVNGASDFRTFRKSVKDAVLSLGEYHRFSKGLFGWVGFNTVYVPYHAQERHSGKSSFNFIKLFKYGINGIIAFSTAPLKFAAWVGSFAILFSIIYAIITVVRKIVSDIQVDGFAQIVILIAFLGGVQLFTIGIIGEYLAKNYIQSKNRPIYIVKEYYE